MVCGALWTAAGAGFAGVLCIETAAVATGAGSPLRSASFAARAASRAASIAARAASFSASFAALAAARSSAILRFSASLAARAASFAAFIACIRSSASRFFSSLALISSGESGLPPMKFPRPTRIVLNPIIEISANIINVAIRIDAPNGERRRESAQSMTRYPRAPPAFEPRFSSLSTAATDGESPSSCRRHVVANMKSRNMKNRRLGRNVLPSTSRSPRKSVSGATAHVASPMSW